MLRQTSIFQALVDMLASFADLVALSTQTYTRPVLLNSFATDVRTVVPALPTRFGIKFIFKFKRKTSSGFKHKPVNYFSVVPIDSSSATVSRQSGEPLVIKTGRHAIISAIKQVFKLIILRK